MMVICGGLMGSLNLFFKPQKHYFFSLWGLMRFSSNLFVNNSLLIRQRLLEEIEFKWLNYLTYHMFNSSLKIGRILVIGVERKKLNINLFIIGTILILTYRIYLYIF